MKTNGTSGRTGRQAPGSDWDDRLNDYAGFVEEHNRTPSSYADDPNEGLLAFWRRNQRASLRNGLLLPERVARMDQLLPGWSSPNWIRPSWDHMLVRAVQFKADSGRWPSGASDDGDERNLANWLYRQGANRTALRDTRHAERLVKLDNALPGWRSRRPIRQDQRWKSRLKQLLDHRETRESMPGTSPSRPAEERALGKWVEVQRHALKKGRLHPERAAQLDDLVAGWRGNQSP